MRKNRDKIIIGFILTLAFVLRLAALDRFPAGFTADEAAQGYTAYSILKTGKDEWGAFLPISPRSFGDYKLPLQTYLMIPSISVFGLNEFAVRLPNAILGSLGILGVFLLVKELFKNLAISYQLSAISSLLLAISPWHISLSRGAFEANLTTFFMPVGLYLFLRGLREPRYLPLSAFLCGLNLFSYHAARLVTPLMVGFLVIWGRKELQGLRRVRRARGKVVLAGVIFAGFVVLALYLTLVGGGTRAADIGIFSAGWKAPRIFIDNYLSYLSPQFLFTRGAGEATYGMIPGRGVLYLFELPLLLVAFWSLAKNWNKDFLPILVWITLAPIPAALSLGVGYHANRVAVMMPGIQILSAYGGIQLWEKVKEGLKGKKGIKKEIHKIATLLFSRSEIKLCLYGCIAVISFLLFLKTYFFDAPEINAPAMSYGWQETMAYLKTQEAKYDKIVISRRFSEPQAFIAFFGKYDPGKFQQEAVDWLRYEKEGLLFIDQLSEYSLGRYEFRNLNFSADKNLKGVLLVGKPEEFPSDFPVQRMIIYPTGERTFYIVNPEKR